ncbi:MAG: hypothetical protein ACE5FA_04065 [Dehalococcoidia bacterium]
MGTRSNVVFQVSDKSRIYLYRNWDGGLNDNGAMIARTLLWIEAGNHYHPATDAVEALLAYRDCYGHPYELTTATHGDIDHFYELSYWRGSWKILHRWGHGEGLEEKSGTPEGFGLRASGEFVGDLEEFVAHVNKDIQKCNKRAVERGYDWRYEEVA